MPQILQPFGRFKVEADTVGRLLLNYANIIALPVLLGANGQGLISASNALDDALNVVQRASQNSAAAAVAKLAVRLAAGDDSLALLVRHDQDLSAEAKRLDDAFIAAVSPHDATAKKLVQRA